MNNQSYYQFNYQNLPLPQENFYTCLPPTTMDYTNSNKEVHQLMNTVQQTIDCASVNCDYYNVNKKNCVLSVSNNYQWMNTSETSSAYVHPNNSVSAISSFSPPPTPTPTPKPTLTPSTTTSTPSTLVSTTIGQAVEIRQQVIENGHGGISTGEIEIEKPQLLFQDKIDNSFSPWIPRITEKPNAIEPLSLNVMKNKIVEHPYKVELEKLEIKEIQLAPCSTTLYKNLDDTEVIFIDTLDQLNLLVENLIGCDEIAVDLEHHSYRSYQGITCLMQISTRETDYLIDTLTLRSDLYVLNKIFTNPNVLKVFHGADNDIQWLQRDLSLYIVNMFDTHQAAIQLNIPPGKRTFSNLLLIYCNIKANKQYQSADWRIRPLPKELVNYSRTDTHYLLYIKDVMHNKLLISGKGKNNNLKSVYKKSTDICKTVYKKPICDNNSFINFYKKSGKSFNKNQLCALKMMYYWRDKIARQEDDSTEYVLPNIIMLNIAEKLPNNVNDINNCCSPMPPLIFKNKIELYSILAQAKYQSNYDSENNNNNNNKNIKDHNIINNITINNNNFNIINNNNNIYNINNNNYYYHNCNNNNNNIYNCYNTNDNTNNQNQNYYSGEKQQLTLGGIPLWGLSDTPEPIDISSYSSEPYISVMPVYIF